MLSAASALFGSCVVGLKSDAASRTFSTPSPVPVRIQSCAKQRIASNQAEQAPKNRKLQNAAAPHK